jgi:hypothetical protein
MLDMRYPFAKDEVVQSIVVGVRNFDIYDLRTSVISLLVE